MSDRRLPIWRSLLYVPANNRRFLDKAMQREADGVVLDLEDSIPPHLKGDTRAGLSSVLDEMIGGRADVLVRINAPLRLAVPDLDAAVRPGVAAIFLPKIESPGHLRVLCDLVGELEKERDIAPGSIGLVPMIETPSALLECEAIARASSRNVAILVGSEDLATEAGFEPSPETLLGPKLRIVMAAKAAGILALGLLDTVAAIRDAGPDLARRSAAHGFDGSTCVHPAVVPILNQAFSPDELALDLARRTIVAMENAHAEGKGATMLDGRMIDMPMLTRARRLVERDRLIRTREQERVSETALQGQTMGEDK